MRSFAGVTAGVSSLMSAVVSSCLVLSLAPGPAWPQDAAAAMPDPDDGRLEGDVYVSRYFGMSYPLLPGWGPDLPGPDPSHRGYYVLASFAAAEERAMMLITAQDTFFAPAPLRDGAAAARTIGDATAAIEGQRIDLPPSPVTIAGRPFQRVDYSGFGLWRSTLVTAIRCHLVSFNVTAASADLRAKAVSSLDRLGRLDPPPGGDPACQPDGALPDRIVTRIDPAASGPYSPPIPVRLVIDTRGAVTHVHVIRATAGQRAAITAALQGWRLQPPALDGEVTALETGVLIQFTPSGVNYLAGDRAPPG